MATEISKLNSIKDVPTDQIHARSKDGKTLVLVDGTKVSDKLIAEAKAKPAKKDAAATGTGKDPFADPIFETRVRAIVAEEVQRIFDQSKAGT